MAASRIASSSLRASWYASSFSKGRFPKFVIAGSFQKAQQGAGDDERLESRESRRAEGQGSFSLPKLQAPVTTPKALARACILSLSLPPFPPFPATPPYLTSI